MRLATGAGRPVDVVVVNFNAARHLAACLAGLTHDPDVGSIVVVDNASTDDSIGVVAAAAPDAVWLPTGANLGFGRAANRGIAATRAPFVLIVNPDLTVSPGALGALVAHLRADPACGVAGPRVVSLDGATYPSARAFPTLADALGHGFVGLVKPDNRWSRRYRHEGRTDWVSGTAMLCRRTALEAVGGFDEDYFMYVEDVDLCWRIRLAGWGVGYVPGAVVEHEIGGSSEAAPYRMIAAHHRSLLRFANRTTRGAHRLLLPVVALGLAARALAVSAKRWIRRKPPAAL